MSAVNQSSASLGVGGLDGSVTQDKTSISEARQMERIRQLYHGSQVFSMRGDLPRAVPLRVVSFRLT